MAEAQKLRSSGGGTTGEWLVRLGALTEEQQPAPPPAEAVPQPIGKEPSGSRRTRYVTQDRIAFSAQELAPPAPVAEPIPLTSPVAGGPKRARTLPGIPAVPDAPVETFR